MAVAYLDWLTELFDEAQVPYTPESAVWLDQSLRRIAAVPAGPAEPLAEPGAAGSPAARQLPSGRGLLPAGFADASG
jgi:hypothetical protein